jgi:putative ABC transport system permease protein
MSAEIGPIWRTIRRRKSAFLLSVLELASGFTIICCLFLAGSWYQQVGTVHSSDHDDALVEALVQQPWTARTETASARAAGPGVALDEVRPWQVQTAAIVGSWPRVLGSAAVSTSLIDDRLGFPVVFHAVDSPPSPGDASAKGGVGWTIRVAPSAAEVLGLKVLEGPAWAEVPAARRLGGVAITRCLRDRLFPAGEAAVGQRVTSGDLPTAVVLAVVEEVYMRRPFMADTQCQAFAFSANAGDERSSRILLRTLPQERDAIAADLRRALVRANPGAAVSVQAYTLENARQYRITHGILIMLVIMAVNVAVVAMLGPLAVSSFLVAERTRQIGVRRALGATRWDIIRYFLVENAIAVALGTALGGVVTASIFGMMSGAFYKIDLAPWHFGAAAILLWLEGTLAAMIPALRAAQIAPSVAARSL